MSKLQPLSAKLGEVKFRQKLIEQHLDQSQSFSEEPDRKEILKILKQRIEVTRKIFSQLKKRGFILSPFLEIGAEKGQRSMVLVNDFGARGFAVDISRQSLAASEEFAKILGFPKLPIFICADAYHLPFADESVPFIFCFETLHHFPDPAPVLKEIYRVLTPGGTFYFGEEPIKQFLNLRLWRRGYHLNPLERVLKMIGLLPFLSRIGGAETRHGVLEEEFGFDIWKKALLPFEEVETTVSPVFFGPKSTLSKKGFLWKDPGLLTALLINLQGGGIEGLVIKEGKFKPRLNHRDLLICPDCKIKILKKTPGFLCPNCQRRFNQREKVWMLLPDKLQKKLYD